MIIRQEKSVMRSICSACEDDSVEILSLYRDMYHGPAGWNEKYPNEEFISFDISRDAIFVMKEDGRIIGTISIDEDKIVDELDCWDKDLKPWAEIARICVSEDMQGKGIASEMINYVILHLKSQKYKSIHLLVRDNHESAIRLYSKLGFVIKGPCAYLGHDYFCMEMDISM